MCVPLVGRCASATEQARQASLAGCHRGGLGQRCLLLGNEPEAGAREAFAGGRETIEGLVDAAAAHRCELLPLTAQVASTFHHLPLLGRHRDPFDRMLVWQAIQHHLTLVSRDRAMEAYQTEGLKILW